MFTCKLCQERLDGNNASKEHYIKEYKTDMIHKKLGNKCEYRQVLTVLQLLQKYDRSMKGSYTWEGLTQEGRLYLETPGVPVETSHLSILLCFG